MKKIGILSDTHGYLDDRILHYLEDRDEIWHAGDWGTIDVADRLKKIAPIRGVYGNIDGKEVRLDYPEIIRFKCENVDVFITHIGGYPGKYSPAIKAILQASPPNLFICGHSHITKVIRDPKLNLLHINPGAAGISGFHKVRTMILLEVDGTRLQNLRLIELGNRAIIG
jgi:putative phosphoesterase